MILHLLDIYAYLNLASIDSGVRGFDMGEHVHSGGLELINVTVTCIYS